MEIGAIDRKILRSVQRDISRPLEYLAETVGLSRNAVWRRLKSLEQHGYIDKKVALLNPQKLGNDLLVFIQVRTIEHDAAWCDRFAVAVKRIPQILSAHRMTGDLDYLIKARVKNVEEYDSLYQNLTRQISLNDVSASFVMESLKDTTELPF